MKQDGAKLTTEQRSLSRRFIIYKTLSSFWFVGAIWLYFYNLFITDAQVGLLDGMAFAIGLVAEVPSGVLADRFGRDKMTRLGQLLVALGILFQGLGSTFGVFFFWQAVTMIGVSFISGADEALFFDRLKFKKTSTRWRNLVTRASQSQLVASIAVTLIGGWFYTFSPRLPWIATGVAFLGATVVIWTVKESRRQKSGVAVGGEIREHIRGIWEGFAQFRLPAFRYYVPVIVIVQGLFYTVGWGILRLVLVERFTFSAFESAFVIASSMLITVIVLSYLHKKADRVNEKNMIVVISLIAAASLLLSVAGIGKWGYVVILALYAGEHILYPFMSEVLNYRASESQRATILSVASFLRAIPYVVLGPLIGFLNTNNQLEYFLVTWTVLILVAVAIYWVKRGRGIKVALESEPTETEERAPDTSG